VGNDEHFFLDRDGNQLLGPYDFARSFRDGIAVIGRAREQQLLTRAGEIIPVRGVNWVSEYCSYGLIGFLRGDDNEGFMNRLGEVVIPARFEEASTFYEGLSAVKLNGRKGYIDMMGEFVIEPRFDEASSFRDGIARVLANGRTFFIDRRGNTLTETHYSAPFTFSEGLTPVYKTI
jgi:hypothetical protein